MWDYCVYHYFFIKYGTSLKILGESKAIYRVFCFHRGSGLRRVLVLRFSGDVTVKSPSVASKWQRIILQHVKWRIDGKADARLFHSRIIVYPSETIDEIELLNAVRTLFGLSSISPGFEVRTDTDEIVDAVHKLAGKAEGISLIPYKIVGINENPKEFFDKILRAFDETGLRIDKTSERKFFIETRGEKTFIFDEVIECVGGLPYGVGDKLVSLMSGGPDSTLSTWLMMRRGSPIVGVYIPLGGLQAKKRALASAVHLFSNWTPRREGKLYVIEIDDILDEIALHAREKTSHVIFKRCILRVAGIISIIEQAKGIVTGELAGEHASQTIWNLHVISEAVKSFPIYRPVIGFDKMEVINKIKEIDEKLFEIVNKSVEECTRIKPEIPATRVQLSEIKRIEKVIDCSWKRLINKIVASGRILYIKDFRITREERVKISSEVRKNIIKTLTSKD